MQEVEAYLKGKGFENIDPENGLVSMYQMFLIVFVKRHFMKDINAVRSQTDAKGRNVLFTTVGNKGGICYSFVFKNRVFNIIGSHLQHKRESQEKRNFMSRELIQDFKMQGLQNRITGLESDQ